MCLHIRYDNYLCRFMEFTLGALANDIFWGSKVSLGINHSRYEYQ